MRLQKYLASCGVASRRHAEEMIAQGLVSVNGQVITQMGVQVEETDEVRVKGEIVKPEAVKKYVLYHKPIGEVTTVSDPEGRPTVMQHFTDYPVRLYPVGRLDFDSEGLLLLTNDGDLADKMMHPSNEVDKTYLARVTGKVTLESVRELRMGVMLDDHKTSPARVRIIKDFELNWPVTETEDAWFVNTNGVDCNQAIERGYRELLRLISDAYGWDNTDSTMYMSLQALVEANQAVLGPNYLDEKGPTFRVGVPKLASKPRLIP